MKYFLLGFGLALFLADTRGADAPRPNILWVVIEDSTASFLGAYGDPLARTPAFDRIAREGILYERAYSTSAVCAPTRASIITGMYATSLGTQHMRSTVRLPAWLRYFPAYLRDAGYFTTNCAKTDYNAEVLPGTWDENGAKAHWRHRAPGQPFFSVFNFGESHESSLHKRLPLQTDPAAVRLPAYLPDTPEVRADFAQYFDRVAEADRKVAQVLAELAADGLADDTIVFYYSDHGGVLPRSKRFLFENGTHPALAVFIPPKFRALAPADPGTRSRELVNFVDLAPTVLSLAGVKAPAHFQGRAFAGPARSAAPATTYSFRDRMDERYDLCRAVTDGRWRYIRNYRPELPTLQHLDYLWEEASMRDWDRLHREGKLSAVQDAAFGAKPVEQLFDCDADPDNVRDLAADPKQRTTLERLRAANRKHLLETRDAGFMPEAMLREFAGGGAPYDVAQDPARYPLERLLDALDRLQLTSEPAATDVTAMLRDDNPVVRFWGALNALRVSRNAPLELESLLKDRTGSVRLAAAFALARRGHESSAWPVLAAALGSGQPKELQLEALNYLTNLPRPPDTFHALLESAARRPPKGPDYVARAARFLLERDAK